MKTKVYSRGFPWQAPSLRVHPSLAFEWFYYTGPRAPVNSPKSIQPFRSSIPIALDNPAGSGILHSIVNQKRKVNFMYTLTNNKTGKTIELTEDEVGALYDALADFQDYGEEEAEMSFDLRSKLDKV